MTVFRKSKTIIKKILDVLMRPVISGQQKNLLLCSDILVRQNNSLKKINDLSDVEFSVFSQWGEDGILSWIIDKLEVVPESFIEFGVENYTEANTRYLLSKRNWSGLVIDGSLRNISEIKAANYFWRYDLQAKQEFITAENIDQIILDSGFNGEIGVLSIDIDGNDYWVWKAISCVDPIIVIIEYNALLGDQKCISTPYDPAFVRGKKHFSHVYFGGSVRAMCDLAAEKGYTFIGTNSNGVNAFFVRSDCAQPVLDKMDAVVAYPSKLREARNSRGALSFSRGIDRVSPIQDCAFIDLSKSKSKTVSLRSLGDIYSKNWLAGKKSEL
ncbi:hypothetical protein [Thalassospira sp. HJ]|uniref:hypothetical protein n=1 Tax=Thalassospira sp. HJ TaxID=1616823 RepID=UPI00126A7688|nr:hypothetical protein [Thalassospira sp. HJ]